MEPSGPVLGRRALNRALLARQHLLERRHGSVLDEVAHLVGLQAQAPWSPYTALWSRLAEFRPDELGGLLLGREAVRVAAMRATVHLVTADDALLLPSLTASIGERGVRGAGPFSATLHALDPVELARAARELLEAEPMTPARLGRRLLERWPDAAPDALAHGARYLLPLVQTPPRAVWGRSGATVWTTTRAWLGREPAGHDDPEARHAALQEVVRRYLGAFGPASVADVQRWIGLTRLAPVVRSLRQELVAHRAAPGPSGRPGRELFDLPDAPRPDPETPAPVRFLPDFDNALLSHADRTRIVGDPERRALARANGQAPGTVLVDGFVAAAWSLRRERSAATLEVRPLRPLTSAERADVAAEAEELVAFLARDSASRAVVWASGLRA
ncbi:winged helix DNA-binding domain-containing protein [Cellulomonas chengniuliangii]|uniref:Winged helix DNA-binding domain-containing protein n=1 Tax=Cellulomonas chengniuliangii TaxID=2968084 RepID=A0ABY5KVB5_9CELL|nr:winged helix DNA-binding domain-containing protein [Cellulomonas chengniuliangii]MCC2308774.1 winged helix DNA-binding domain-containing protein [Cellulomonas chengniuliangii]MCC2316902.1 winged helix DNA-binding domain-containing protein [Cellulomonas chengniuliangii]UUI74477.1 winged helix DNA-binding domain-containing protein [Cellulomonas chengniuliangii]